MEPVEHLDIRETARIMGRTTDAVRALIEKGELPGVRVGGRRDVLAKNLHAFLLAQSAPLRCRSSTRALSRDRQFITLNTTQWEE